MMKEKAAMGMINHYEVLGLPSGVEGTKLSQVEISKAFRSKALELHPDKRPNDPEASAEFQKLKSSYDLLTNPTSRKIFDDRLLCQSQPPNQRQMMEEERLTQLRQWLEYERLKEAFLSKLMTRK